MAFPRSSTYFEVFFTLHLRNADGVSLGTVIHSRLTSVKGISATETRCVCCDVSESLGIVDSPGKNTVVAVAEGVKVQWASRNEEEDENTKKEEPTAETAHGLMEWIINIEPGSTTDVNLSWEVVAPAGVEWVTNGY